MNWIKENILPILLVLGGIIDQSTDLFVQLLADLGAPNWAMTLLRIIVVGFGARALYLAKSPKVKKEISALVEDSDIGGGGIKNPPKP